MRSRVVNTAPRFAAHLFILVLLEPVFLYVDVGDQVIDNHNPFDIPRLEHGLLKSVPRNLVRASVEIKNLRAYEYGKNDSVYPVKVKGKFWRLALQRRI